MLQENDCVTSFWLRGGGVILHVTATTCWHLCCSVRGDSVRTHVGLRHELSRRTTFTRLKFSVDIRISHAEPAGLSRLFI